ncbi:MAG: tRNA (adenosine(37)-N6)-threonylcarbamoyltransferase complex dimerization subunit type 1 TsaB [Patescibacteria group bacterium]
MQLYINTTKEDEIELAIINKKKIVAKKVFTAKYAQAEKLLPAIEKLLKDKKLKLKDIKRIKVANSGGSFTALRIGVITANALAYALGVPVKGESGQALSYKGIKIIKPVYSQEPNITVKKK